MDAGVRARAVIVNWVWLLAMCWISKPANVNGSICPMTFPSSQYRTFHD